MRTCSKDSLPILLGGDFNIIRRPEDNNNNNFNDRWPFLFNTCIDTVNLREVELSDRKLTWAKRLQNQTFERLDRVLFCTDLESKFPQTTLHALTREILDHTPLLLNTNNSFSSY